LPSSQAPKFSELTRHDLTAAEGHETTQDLRRRLTDLPEAELLPAVTDLVRTEIAQILRIAPDRIESATSLFDMGMDSLMAVELATSIEGRLGIQLSALALSNAPTIERIAARIAQQLRPGDDGSHPNTAIDVTLAGQAHMLAAQHASDITHEEANALSTEMETSAPISLTAGQSS
jgi:phthiocerol/phenolphthiocerol synthesis type-I polyketide synthase C